MFILTGVKVPAEDEQRMFNSTMSDDDFFKWLRSKGISEKDCNALSGKFASIFPIFYLIFLALESR